MNNFVYDIPTKVYFGENQLGHLGKELSKYGKKVLLAYGGGSVIDCTKYIGAAAFYDGDAWDILEQKTDVKQCLPIVDILMGNKRICRWWQASGVELSSNGA